MPLNKETKPNQTTTTTNNNNNNNNLEELEVDRRVETIQTTALLRTAR